ncbi:hypothetical protein F5B20DRAFT_593427 [Whalleya microplaca]|nr:hypothetical protein F5B20DRAFT_593427 [Whalleya microplaca]
MLGRILLTLDSLCLIFGAPIADYSHTHMFNPRWPPHAKFHNGQTISLSVLLGLTTLYYTWRKPDTPLLRREYMRMAAILGSVYWLSGLSAILYPGTMGLDPEFGGPGFPQRWLNCDPYISFVPLCDEGKGGVVSNALFNTSQNRISPPADKLSNDDAVPHLDYSWLAEHYPIPASQDLLRQIDAFLATPQPQRPPRETLWIFNFGFWDIWNLAALPRKLAASVIDTQAQHIFSNIEHLYQESRNNISVAFSDYYRDANLTDVPTNIRTLPRPLFRIFIPRLFDISLTPGFESARFKPPYPHNKAEQMRNAAFLTRHWDVTIQDMMDVWLRLPEPETKTDLLSSIEHSDLLVVKGDRQLGGSDLPLARRDVIAYDVFGYILELIVEGQLREVDVVDNNGLGSKLADKGFSEVEKPCLFQPGPSKGDENVTADGAIRNSGEPCESSDDHLFWTEFTVSQRAIDEVGKRAAEQLKRHTEMDVQWLKKVQHP